MAVFGFRYSVFGRSVGWYLVQIIIVVCVLFLSAPGNLVAQDVTKYPKQELMLGFEESGEWIDLLHSCIENRVGKLSHIEIVESGGTYLLSEVIAEENETLVASYTILEIPELEYTMAGVLIRLQNEGVLSINENFDPNNGHLVKLAEKLNEDAIFKANNDGLQSFHGQMIMRYSINEVPKMCQSITEFVDSEIMSTEEMFDYWEKNLN